MSSNHAAALPLHDINFTKSQFEEVESMLELFQASIEETGGGPCHDGDYWSLTRPQWISLAHMCLGKAQRIRAGDYGVPVIDNDGRLTGEIDHEGEEEWIEDLEDIANTIFHKFQPGDGNL